MLAGQNGILNRAVDAKEKTEDANKDEQRKLAQAEALMNTEKTTYKGLTLPEGFAPTKIEGEDSISEGLVITDGYGNEYIWVEVPITNELYSTTELGITNFTDSEYQKIEEDLHTYTSTYRNETEYKDEFVEDETDGWFKEKDDYETAKKKMLKSVYQNGGFWVGRYEAGIEINRTSSGDANKKPLVKDNLYPYTYITRTQAKVLAEQVESGSCTSSLMFGVQWDLVLKYIEVKTVDAVEEANKNTVKAQIIKALKNDSTNIGNYYNSEITLSRGKFAQYGALKDWHEYNSEDKINLVTKSKKVKQTTPLNGILLTTGATEDAKLQNIYDIAGNVWEWTLENTSDASYPCAFRGGGYGREGFYNYASDRSKVPTSHSNNDISLRISIY